jgi:hypothetical protein
MNQDQVLSYVRTTIAAIGGFAIAKGFGDNTLWSDILPGIAAILVHYIWGRYVHSDPAKVASIATMSFQARRDAFATIPNSLKLTSVAEMPGPEKLAAFNGIPDGAKIAAVEAIPQVQKIVVDRTATDGVADAASDPSRPKVVTAPDPLKMVANSDQRK